MKPYKDYLIIKTEEILEDKSRFKGVDGHLIYLNVLHDPVRHVRCYGQVVETPMFLSHKPLVGCHTYLGKPNYHQERRRHIDSLKRVKDIHQTIEIGDVAYFHYNTLLPPTNGVTLFNNNYIKTKKEIEGGVERTYHYYRVSYDQVFMVARYTKVDEHTPDFYMSMPLKRITDGVQNVLLKEEGDNGKALYRRRYIGVGSWCLIRPDYESWDDLLVPIPAIGSDGKPMINPVTGKKIMKDKKDWLVTKAAPGLKDLQGWVEVVDDPLIGDENDGEIKIGQHIYIRPKTDTLLVVDGINYFRTMQRNINACTDKKYIPLTESDRKPLSFGIDVVN